MGVSLPNTGYGVSCICHVTICVDKIRGKLPSCNKSVLASKSLFYLVRGIRKYSNMYITSHLSDDGPGSQIQGMWPES